MNIEVILIVAARTNSPTKIKFLISGESLPRAPLGDLGEVSSLQVAADLLKEHTGLTTNWVKLRPFPPYDPPGRFPNNRTIAFPVMCVIPEEVILLKGSWIDPEILSNVKLKDDHLDILESVCSQF